MMTFVPEDAALCVCRADALVPGARFGQWPGAGRVGCEQCGGKGWWLDPATERRYAEVAAEWARRAAAAPLLWDGDQV
jgi:hypothetical protein